MRRILPALVALALLAAGCSSDEPGNTTAATTGEPTVPSDEGVSGDPPNILYVLADDMDLTDADRMPNLQRLIVDQGVTFANNFATVSLCCPSRTTMLRGQYSHNTGIESNRGNGGFVHFHEQGLEDSTFATWLQDAGYRTAFAGKYLNDYPQTAGDTYVPPGWDDWGAPVGLTAPSEGNIYNQYDYILNDNGTLVEHGHAPEDYGGTVYTERVRDFIRASADDDQPFFAYLSLISPHLPATPAPQDEDAPVPAQAPRTPSFNEEDVTDKPGWIRELGRFSEFDRQYIDGLYQARQRANIGIDREIGQLVRTLRQTGQLDDTYIVFTSDNGHHLGQHTLRTGKQTGYDEDIHLPLMVRGPGVPAGETADAIVSNIDLAPTLAELAGADVPGFVDGRSYVDLLADPGAGNSRQSLLIEHWKEQPGPGEDPSAADLQDVTPEFHGIRTVRYTYIEYDGGDVELYDNVADPDQLDNLAATADPELLAAFANRLAELVDCTADACRAAEDAEVPS